MKKKFPISLPRRQAGNFQFPIFFLWTVIVMILYIIMLGKRGGIW